jgi:hypothetical protein
MERGPQLVEVLGPVRRVDVRRWLASHRRADQLDRARVRLLEHGGHPGFQLGALDDLTGDAQDRTSSNR